MKPVSLANISYESALKSLSLSKEASDSSKVGSLGRNLIEKFANSESAVETAEKLAAETGIMSTLSNLGSQARDYASKGYNAAKGYANQGISSASSALNSLTPEQRNALTTAGVGLGLGAATGALSADKKRNRMRNALMGGIAGGAIGAGVGVAAQPKLQESITNLFSGGSKAAPPAVPNPNLTVEQARKMLSDAKTDKARRIVMEKLGPELVEQATATTAAEDVANASANVLAPAATVAAPAAVTAAGYRTLSPERSYVDDKYLKKLLAENDNILAWMDTRNQSPSEVKATLRNLLQDNKNINNIVEEAITTKPGRWRNLFQGGARNRVGQGMMGLGLLGLGYGALNATPQISNLVEWLRQAKEKSNIRNLK